MIGPEICITKIEGCNQFRIFYIINKTPPSSFLTFTELKYFEIEILNNNIIEILQPTILETLNSSFYSIVVGSDEFFDNQFLFFAGQNELNNAQVFKYDLGTTFPNSGQLIFSESNTSIAPFELELSNNNKFLASSNFSISPLIEVTVLHLKSDGTINSSMGISGITTFNIPKANNLLKSTGLEFSPNDDYLYVGIENTGIFQIDLINESISSSIIQGSETFGNSHLESAKNGKIYCFNGVDYLGGFDGGSPSPQMNELIPLNINWIPNYNPVHTSHDFFTLPQQIDNFDTDNYFRSSFECCNNNIGFEADEFTVTQTTTWLPNQNPFGVIGTDIYIKNKIIIPPNVQLIIKDLNIFFAPGASIEVQAGTSPENRAGKLIVDNSTLTVDQRCTDDKLWKGIWASGNKNFNQGPLNNSYYQSRVIIKNNSIIEHAEVAVALWNGKSFNTSGAWLTALNSTFRNNFLDVYFPPYKYKDFSSISNTVFLKDAPLLNGKAYSTMVYLNERKEIAWKDNSFLVTHPVITQDPIYHMNNPNTPYGGRALTGIYAIDSDIRMQGYNNVFQGLNQGIWSNAGVKQPNLVLDELTFLNCKRSIRVEAVDGATITRNDIRFNLASQQPYNPQLEPPFSVFGNEITYGISLNALTGYTVEENIISGGLQPFEFGIRAVNLGGANLDIYKNTIAQCTFSQNALGKNNRSFSGPNGFEYEGLNYECNQNTDNDRDFSIWRNLFTQNLEDIRKNQVASGTDVNGQPISIATGNTFSATVNTLDGHIYNQPIINIQEIDYYYYQPVLIERPTFYTNQFVYLFPNEDYLNECFSRIDEGPGPIGVLAGEKLTESKFRFKLKKGQINSVEYEISGTEDSVLIDSLQRNLVALRTDFTVTGFNLVAHYMRDTSTGVVLQDSLRKYLAEMDNYEAQRMLALNYLIDNNPDQYNTVLESITNADYYQEDEQNELNYFAEFANIVNLLNDSSKSILELDEEAINVLLNIDTNNLFQIGVRAKNILRQYDYHWAEVPHIPNFELRRAAAKQHENSENFNNLINLYGGNFISPNPATNAFTLNLTEVEATSLSITNIHGQEVQFFNVPENSENFKVPLNLKAGVYFVSLFNKETLLGTSKLIIK